MEKEIELISNLLESHTLENTLEENFVVRIAKNNKLSEMLRKKGNNIFNNQLHDSSSHEEIWKLYSRSIALAETNSELALAYANRSAILLHMSKYQDSLSDISRALDLTSNDCLRLKLLIRKVKCLHALGKNKSQPVLREAESLLKNITVQDLKIMYSKHIKQTKSTLGKPHLELPETDKNSYFMNILNKWHEVDDFSFIEIQRDEKYGRCLVAAKKIKAGQVIYVEKPYIHCSNSENTHSYCYNCSATTWASIPCDHCGWAMFCSEFCKVDAWRKYHNIECSLFDGTKKDLYDSCAQLAVKAICLGLSKYKNIENLKPVLSNMDRSRNYTEGFFGNGMLSNSFKSMYLLSNDVSPFKMQKHNKSVVLFLDNVAKSTHLLGKNINLNDADRYKKNKNAMFLGSLYLRMSTISEMNKLQMWNECSMGSTMKLNCWINGCCSKGVYIAPITSLINHSCNPNVNICYSNDHTVILYALRPINKGQQLFRCYLDEYFLIQKELRKKLLFDIYNFECTCEACERNYRNVLVQGGKKRNYYESEPYFYQKYQSLVKSIFSGQSICDEKCISILGKGLKESVAYQTGPTLTTVELMKALTIIFNQWFGITLLVPSTCNSELRFI